MTVVWQKAGVKANLRIHFSKLKLNHRIDHVSSFQAQATPGPPASPPSCPSFLTGNVNHTALERCGRCREATGRGSCFVPFSSRRRDVTVPSFGQYCILLPGRIFLLAACRLTQFSWVTSTLFQGFIDGGSQRPCKSTAVKIDLLARLLEASLGCSSS